MRAKRAKKIATFFPRDRLRKVSYNDQGNGRSLEGREIFSYYYMCVGYLFRRANQITCLLKFTATTNQISACLTFDQSDY